jgi:hypothetical protein
MPRRAAEKRNSEGDWGILKQRRMNSDETAASRKFTGDKTKVSFRFVPGHSSLVTALGYDGIGGMEKL